MNACSVEGTFDWKEWTLSCDTDIQRLEPNLWEDKWEQARIDMNLVVWTGT